MGRLIDTEELLERLHNIDFREEDDRCITELVIASIPTFEKDDRNYNKMINEINYWMNKCEQYESTIIKLSVRLMEREQCGADMRGGDAQ